MALISGLLVRTGLSHFNREELLGRELDGLNLRWGWQVFKRAFTGQGGPLWRWYWHEVGGALTRMVTPLPFMFLAVVLGILAGVQQADVFALPADILAVSHLDQGFIEGLESVQFFSAAGVGSVWLHNLRAILIATLLGIFSFGVFGILVLMLPFILVSYFMANFAAAGVAPVAFLLGLVLPHGTLEIPAILLAGAAIFRLGGTLAAPARGRTIGEAWLYSLADWAKVMLGIVMPLLLGAALLEVFVTPYVATWILGR
jgi:uncharacterized membrane protein SpoIIM required for sporulation